MKYIKFTCSNGFCGCDEDFYEAVEDNVDIDLLATEILQNDYSFAIPDGRFVGDGSKEWDDEITDEEYDEYIENLYVDWEEITKEEYEENK